MWLCSVAENLNLLSEIGVQNPERLLGHLLFAIVLGLSGENAVMASKFIETSIPPGLQAVVAGRRTRRKQQLIRDAGTAKRIGSLSRVTS